MAHHKSALKRIRQNQKRRLQNRYYLKTTRNAIKRLKSSTDKSAAIELLKEVSSMIDKLAKRSIIHKNKAANQKSKLALMVNKLA